MKKTIITLGLLVGMLPSALAYQLCVAQQSTWMEGMSHHHGIKPQGFWDYVVLIICILIVLVVLFFSIKFLVNPGEKDPSHVKYSIFIQKNQNYGK